jgi:intraflagellar transport protein 80
VTRFEEPSVGSLYGVSWSSDGTQIVSGSSTGHLIFGHVIEREVFYKNLKAITTGRRMIVLKDIVNGTTDNLDFSDRIIKWELGYGHLVVATANQIHIFNENYINTPIIIDGRQDVRIIVLGKK